MAESNRQKKIAGVLQKDLATELQRMVRASGKTGVIISVTQVKVTVDLSIAKVYVSVFPSANGPEFVKELAASKSRIKHHMAMLTKDQLRKMPDLQFYLDDSLEYIDGIEKAVQGHENPLEDPDLLVKRKKK